MRTAVFRASLDDFTLAELEEIDADLQRAKRRAAERELEAMEEQRARLRRIAGRRRLSSRSEGVAA